MTFQMRTDPTELTTYFKDLAYVDWSKYLVSFWFLYEGAWDAWQCRRIMGSLAILACPVLPSRPASKKRDSCQSRTVMLLCNLQSVFSFSLSSDSV